MSSDPNDAARITAEDYAIEKRVTGTMVNYLLVCKRKLWLSSRGLVREQDSELVTLGALMHGTSFPRRKKEILVLGRIKIDHTTKGERVIVHEVKKTKKYSDAARAQLLFYIYELEKLGIQCHGELHFRSEVRKEPVFLDEEARNSMENIIEQVNSVVRAPAPPEPDVKAPCRRCSYRDYCRV